MAAQVGFDAERWGKGGGSHGVRKPEAKVVRALEDARGFRGGGEAERAQPRDFTRRQTGNAHRGAKTHDAHAGRPGSEHGQGHVENQTLPALGVDLERLGREWAHVSFYNQTLGEKTADDSYCEASFEKQRRQRAS